MNPHFVTNIMIFIIFYLSVCVLYPKGSYSRLMSKCQVVDMSTMTPEQQKIAMNQHAGNQSQTPPPPVPPAVKESVPNKESREAEAVKMEEALSGFGNLGKGFLEGKELGGKPSKAEFRPSADALFDRMISGQRYMCVYSFLSFP